MVTKGKFSIVTSRMLGLYGDRWSWCGGGVKVVSTNPKLVTCGRADIFTALSYANILPNLGSSPGRCHLERTPRPCVLNPGNTGICTPITVKDIHPPPPREEEVGIIK